MPQAPHVYRKTCIDEISRVLNRKCKPGVVLKQQVTVSHLMTKKIGLNQVVSCLPSHAWNYEEPVFPE